jgi:phage shock protein PspC (stress-responsive transcriptional regulator)
MQLMKKLFDLLKSERPLVAGAFGRLAEEFGLDRAATRIIGFVILWAGPYWFGASVLDAWWLSILGYIGFALIMRKVSYFRRNRYQYPARRWKEQRCTVITNQNTYDCNGRATGVNEPPEENEGTTGSTVRSAAAKTADDQASIGKQLGNALTDLEERLARLDRRIQKMETLVTDRSFDWDRRLRRG